MGQKRDLETVRKEIRNDEVIEAQFVRQIKVLKVI